MEPFIAVTPPVGEARPPLHDAIAAFEVLRLPFGRRRQLVWNPMMSGPLYEAYERQMQWIAALHVPGPDVCNPPAFELRFLGGNPPGVVEVFFLARASAPTADAARARALELATNACALCPPDYVLQPLTEARSFERAAQSSHWADLHRPEQIAEVRQFERWLLPPHAGTDHWPFYAVHGWQWQLQGLETVWCALGRHRCRMALCINLMPMVWDAADYACYDQLLAARRRDGFPVAAIEVADSALAHYRGLLQHTARPFAMRVTLAGDQAVPDMLAQAVGTALTLPSLQSPASPTGHAQYVIARPSGEADLAAARSNLERLGQLAWGEDLAPPPMRRWRYAVDARQANAAFRLPVVPDGGYPGVIIGAEAELDRPILTPPFHADRVAHGDPRLSRSPLHGKATTD